MIRITHLRDVRRTGEETVIEVIFGQAVNDLLSLYAKFSCPQVGASDEMVTASDGPLSLGLTSYKPVGFEDDYDKLYCMSRLLQILTIAHADEKRGKILDVDFDVVKGAAAYQAHGRQTVTPTKQSYADYQAILGFIIQWLLGRELEVPLGTPDDTAATLLALEQELDGGAKFELTRDELLSA